MTRVLLVMVALSLAADAQERVWTKEVFGSVGYGKVYRVGDNPLDSGFSPGVGAGVRHRSGLGFTVEAYPVFGLSARPAPCAILNVECTGTGREGVESVTVVSLNVRYHFFRGSAVQPFVTGGIGGLRSSGFSTTIFASETAAQLVENAWSDNGLAISFGGGVRIGLKGGILIRPELRIHDASIRSRANLSLFRASVAFGYEW